MTHLSQIRINLDAIHHNLRTLRRIVGPDCRVCPIVKADAYGLGMVPIARQLDAAGVEMMAVYSPAEAAELLGAAVGCEVLILMPLMDLERRDDTYRGLMQGNVHLTVHDRTHLTRLIEITRRYGLRLKLHVEVDTGMGRGGSYPQEAAELLECIHVHDRFRLTGVFTHFASAESDAAMTRTQMDRFEALLDACGESIPEDCVIHTANSSATLRDARYHQRMVRVGFGWAGYASDMLVDTPAHDAATCFRPCMTWESTLIQIKHLAPGDTVGYGSRWVAPRDSIIGVVPVGYASGYPNRVGATTADDALGWVRVVLDESDATSGEGAMYAPVVGAVSMDQLTIDLTDIAQRRDDRQPQVGDVVELITADAQAPNHLPTLAANARKLPYEIICGLHQRVRRRYDARMAPTPEILVEGRASIAAVG